jgi:hypothetical protein
VVVIARSFAVACACLLVSGEARAATGCDLNFPDRDIPRLVTGASRYTLSALSLSPAQLAAIAAQLDERYRALYEPLNVPYTVYEVFKGKERVGYVHGVNQKGQYGGIQLFVALDLAGTVRGVYIQKITGPSAAKLREKALLDQLVGVRLADFESFDPVTGKGEGRLASLKNPAPDMETDFYGVLRALKKNLVLMEVLVYGPGRKKT